jgi:hypothetical protein
MAEEALNKSLDDLIKEQRQKTVGRSACSAAARARRRRRRRC